MGTEDRIKLFGMSHSLVERDLDRIEKEYHLDLDRFRKESKNDDYYLQLGSDLRVEAAKMAEHYELFYCLENSIRKLISETLESACGENWWEICVPPILRTNVQKNIDRDRESGVTLRSIYEIDFTTFGELGEIVRTNWNHFDAIFSSEKAFTKIMTNLNILRNPIAHCSVLAEDEIIRLQLTLKDWFRLME